VSYRNLIEPQQALAQTLQAQGRRIDALERRVRWPGATQFIEQSFPSTLPGYTSIWIDVLTITLDPGDWMIMAGCTVARPFSSAGFTIQARMVGVQGAEAILAGIQDPATPVSRTTVTVNGWLRSTSPTWVTLEVRYSLNVSPQPDATTENTFIIAYPV
jgi:hypothetical protein